eukprot:NODE_24325_length_231_cov_1.961538_g23155_i0.p2 GENE.NODE_24325_length_231_cov_1.961538_g23155_i0~~NODE_24325_length_231_cov_1.961538_g23155_i0.p2  ORF type:complete len:72 (-),score=1.13 NODE_24325_length_231_cov_1.961538_g23155_i0:15-203(-)
MDKKGITCWKKGPSATRLPQRKASLLLRKCGHQEERSATQDTPRSPAEGTSYLGNGAQGRSP